MNSLALKASLTGRIQFFCASFLSTAYCHSLLQGRPCRSVHPPFRFLGVPHGGSAAWSPEDCSVGYEPRAPERPLAALQSDEVVAGGPHADGGALPSRDPAEPEDPTPPEGPPHHRWCRKSPRDTVFAGVLEQPACQCVQNARSSRWLSGNPLLANEFWTTPGRLSAPRQGPQERRVTPMNVTAGGSDAARTRYPTTRSGVSPRG